VDTSTVGKNKATVSGGGIRITGGDVDIISSTIAANSATTSGGGLSITVPGVRAISSIIAKNTASTGADVNGDLLAERSLIQAVSGLNLTDSNNLTEIDPLLGALKFNGGPTQTMAPSKRSPLVDAGSAEDELFDQNGSLRIRGYGADTGAVEVA
jgi:hypothetical protein